MSEDPQLRIYGGILSTRAANTIRYSLMNLFLLFGIGIMAYGGWLTWLGIISTAFLMGLVDELLGDASDKEAMPPIWYMRLMLRLTFPLILIMSVVMLNTISDNGQPWIDAFVRLFGFDPEAARERTGFYSAEGALVSFGMYLGVAGIVVAHELIHRVDSPLDVNLGKGLLAYMWHTSFAVEHVHGHHRNVGTPKDCVTARRGENYLQFVIRSTIGQYVFAYNFEKERLRRKGISDRIYNNRFWRGQFLTVLVVAFFVYMLGPIGLWASFFPAAISHLYLEIVDYIEHYGLVRIPGRPVEPRHSWDSYRRVSSGMLYHLPLHSGHHRFATRPFWELHHADNDAPMMPMGYLPTGISALFPPLWNRIIDPRLQKWDDELASEEEIAYLKSIGQYKGTKYVDT